MVETVKNQLVPPRYTTLESATHNASRIDGYMQHVLSLQFTSTSLQARLAKEQGAGGYLLDA